MTDGVSHARKESKKEPDEPATHCAGIDNEKIDRRWTDTEGDRKGEGRA